MPLFQAVLIIVIQSLLASQRKQLRDFSSFKTRLLTRTKRREHISPVLAALHWLPVTFRFDFKVLLLIYKALNGLGPSVIANSLVKYLPSRTLRLSSAVLLEGPSNSRKKIGHTAFVNYAPVLWNILPIDIREASSLNIFKRKLKTYLFTLPFNYFALYM